MNPPSDPGSPRGVGWAALLLHVVVLALSVRSVMPPAVVSRDAPPGMFSAARAMDDVRALAQRPHPAGSDEQAVVRERVAERLTGLGLSVQRQRGEARGAELVNLVVERPGTEPGGRLLLVAHTDSVAAGPGAGDDASGVAVLLEVLRALGRDPPGRYGLVVLFTDGEEAGLLGARLFVDRPGALDGLAAVVNVEARGGGGPSTLFEHGPASGGLVARWADVVPHAFGSSMGPFVYERMPNDTDLTAFRRAGLPGLNLAFFGSADVYHQPDDRPEHLDARSLQHHGANLLAFAREWTTRGPAEGDDVPVFVTLPALGMVVVDAGRLRWAWVGLGVLALAALLGGAGMRWFDGAAGLLLLLATAALPCALAAGAAHLLGGPRAWGAGPSPGNAAATLWVSSGVLLTAVGACLLGGSWLGRRGREAAAVFALFACVVLTAETAGDAPGLSYLPLLVGLSLAFQLPLCRKGHVLTALLVSVPVASVAAEHAHLLAHVGSVSPPFVGPLAAGGGLLLLTAGLPGLLAAGRAGGRAPGVVGVVLGLAAMLTGVSGRV